MELGGIAARVDRGRRHAGGIRRFRPDRPAPAAPRREQGALRDEGSLGERPGERGSLGTRHRVPDDPPVGGGGRGRGRGNEAAGMAEGAAERTGGGSARTQGTRRTPRRAPPGPQRSPAPGDSGAEGREGGGHPGVAGREAPRLPVAEGPLGPEAHELHGVRERERAGHREGCPSQGGGGACVVASRDRGGGPRRPHRGHRDPLGGGRHREGHRDARPLVEPGRQARGGAAALHGPQGALDLAAGPRGRHPAPRRSPAGGGLDRRAAGERPLVAGVPGVAAGQPGVRLRVGGERLGHADAREPRGRGHGAHRGRVRGAPRRARAGRRLVPRHHQPRASRGGAPLPAAGARRGPRAGHRG